jgi:hypothetical protein
MRLLGIALVLCALTAQAQTSLLSDPSLPPSSESPQQTTPPPVDDSQPQESPVEPESPDAPQPEPESASIESPQTRPVTLPSQPAANRNEFPNLNIYLPEGEFDIRLRQLIKNVLFEGQVNYEFADGDVSTFLRYKYYARNFTYRIGVFDTIEFAGVDEQQLDFDRVRGGLLLFELPRNYNRRYFVTMQVDNLSFGDTTRTDNNKANVYTKLGYQFGTPFDERLNSIVAESRARIAPLLTAYREIGPQKLGVAVALTQSFDSLGGNFTYTKLEAEGLKRFDFGNVSFLVSRLHLGSFVQKQDISFEGDGEDERPDYERFSVPRYEFFKLGGRDAMKGIDDQQSRVSDEIHLTNEFFYPIFRNRDYRFLGANFTNFFLIGYMGTGAAGYDSLDFAADAGAGFETSFFVRDYEVFLSAVYAQTLSAPAEWEGNELRFSVRTSR